MHADADALMDAARRNDAKAVELIVRKHFGAGARIESLLMQPTGMALRIRTKSGKQKAFGVEAA